MLRQTAGALLIAALLAAPAVQASSDGTWFAGGSFYGFELNGSGTMATIDDPSTEFNMRRFNAFGLVTTQVAASHPSLGLGWPDSQLPGLQFQLGYRHTWRFTSRLDLFWSFSKRADQYGMPSPVDGVSSLTKQSTQYKQNHVRILLDWTPFEPLPLWFVTGGFEYTSFSARLEFQFDSYLNGVPQERDFYSYEDGGNTLGVVLGSGLILPGATRDSQTYLMFTWAYAPYNGDWFAWDSSINMGGGGLEAGFRVYFNRD